MWTRGLVFYPWARFHAASCHSSVIYFQRLDTDYTDKNNGPETIEESPSKPQLIAVLHNCVIISVIEQETADTGNSPLIASVRRNLISHRNIYSRVAIRLSDRSAARSRPRRPTGAHTTHITHIQITTGTNRSRDLRTPARTRKYRCYLSMLPGAPRRPSQRRFHRYKLLNYKSHYDWWFSLLSRCYQLR